jgi:hypothetical protein
MLVPRLSVCIIPVPQQVFGRADGGCLEVRFKEYGLKSVQVIDNGTGILQEDYPNIGSSFVPGCLLLHQWFCFATALKHHTSKLAAFDDLSTLLTFGFRGEALSSLCALCEDLSVVTSTANQGGLGSRIELDSAGRVTGVTKIARQVCKVLALKKGLLALFNTCHITTAGNNCYFYQPFQAASSAPQRV